MFTMIVIPFVVIFIHLFSSFFLDACSCILKIVFSDSDVDKAKKNDLLAYQEEQKLISMVDEFPKYARIERKINEIKTYLTTSNKRKSQKLLIWKIILNLISIFLGVISYIIFLYVYRDEVALEINPKWTYPMHDLLAFPTSKPGVLSATVWIVICRTTLVHALDLFKTAQ